MSELHEVTEVWKSYFQHLLEGRDDIVEIQRNPEEQVYHHDMDNPPLLLDEVKIAIKKLKNHRSTAPTVYHLNF